MKVSVLKNRNSSDVNSWKQKASPLNSEALKTPPAPLVRQPEGDNQQDNLLFTQRVWLRSAGLSDPTAAPAEAPDGLITQAKPGDGTKLARRRDTGNNASPRLQDLDSAAPPTPSERTPADWQIHSALQSNTRELGCWSSGPDGV